MERRRITIDYAPRKQFLPFHNRKERWACLVAHRRAGKTVATINDTIRRAITDGKPEGRYAYIAPFFNQAKDIAWGYLKRYAGPLMNGPANESELRVDLINGARIRLYGADNADRMRGIGLDGVVLDEVGDFKSGVWTDVVRPLLSDRQGWATFIGTPKGKNYFYEIMHGNAEMLGAVRDPAWYALTLKASETGLIPAEELEDARRQMGQDQYRQEYECSFDASLKGAYYSDAIQRAEAESRIGRVPIDRGLPVHTCWDLGISDSTACWFVQVVGRGGEKRLIDYYESSGVGLDHYAKVLNDKGYTYGQHYFPHDVGVKELGSGKSRVDTLRGLGITPEIVPASNVEDGINATRRLLDQCWIDAERCARGLEALKSYRREYDEKLKDWKARPLHDWSSHGADALRTFATGYEDRVPLKPLNVAPRGAGAWMGG